MKYSVLPCTCIHVRVHTHTHILKTAVPLPMTTHENVQANKVIARPLPSKMTSYMKSFGTEFYNKKKKGN